MKNILLVFLGGGLGSAGRYMIYRLMLLLKVSSTIGTFTVNVTGSLLLGFLMGYLLQEQPGNSRLMLLIGTGFCGGFTTFSTFALENNSYLRSGDYTSLAIYILSSLVLGVAAIFLGGFLYKIFLTP